MQSITTVPPAWPALGEDRLACEARRCFPDICGQEVWHRWEDDPDFDLTRPYSGFEPVCLTIGHADEQYGHWRRCLREQVADADRLIGPEPSLTPGITRAAHRQVWRTRVPEEFDPIRYIAERCGDWLAERADDGLPFLTRSFPDSHHPFTPPWRFWDMYHPEDVELPANSDTSPRQLPPAMTPLREAAAVGRAREFGHMVFAGMEREAHETLAETLDIDTTVLVRAGTQRRPTGCKGCRCWWSSTDTAIAPPTGWSSRMKGRAAISVCCDACARACSLITPHHRGSPCVCPDTPGGDLYDRLGDPHERRSLWSGAAALALRVELTDELALWMIRRTDTSPYPEAYA